MTQPTPAAAELQAALTWDTPPTVCPICTRPLIEHFDTIGSLIADYECGQTLRKDKEADSYSLSPVRTCRNWATAAVAQRQRAEDAERDYAVLLKDYNAAAAWLGVLESGDDLEVAAKSLTDQLSDVLQRADKAEADRDVYHAHADREYEQRIRLVQDYDKLDAQKDALEAELVGYKAGGPHVR